MHQDENTGHVPGDSWEEEEPRREEETLHDASSDYESELEHSIFGSLTSTVTSHIWEYGRRYHRIGDGKYLLPNDDEECDREALMHIALKELMEGKLYCAPIGTNPHKIIDLGTGFGEWAVEIAEEFPSAKVIGVDLSPVQPSWVPPNVEFVVDDIEGEWKYGDDVDFIHLRFVVTTMRDHTKLNATLFENLKPGGWLEMQDLHPRIAIVGGDSATVAAHPISKCFALVADILRQIYEYDVDCLDNIPQKLQDQGFINIQRRIYNVPIGDWPSDQRLKLVGAEFRVVLIDLLRAFSARPLAEAGLDKSELEDMIGAAQNALVDRRTHAYCTIQAVWAQKPT